MTAFQATLVMLTILGLCYAAYLGGQWASWFAWWNPYDFSKGIVDGNAMKEEERLQFETEQANARLQEAQDKQIKKEAEELARFKQEQAFREERLRKLRESIANPPPPKKTLFAGSKVTKSKRLSNIEAAEKDPGFRSSVIGTVEAGVRPAPKNYPPKIDTRRPGGKLKGITG